MSGSKFTVFPKFLDIIRKLPAREDQAKVALAIMEYGCEGDEPELEFPLDMAFEACREDVENSKKARNENKGGRPKKQKNNGGLEDEETGVITGVSDSEESALSRKNGGLEGAEPKPIQTNPNHKEKINKKENFGEEETGASPTKPDGPRCSLCGSELKRRPVFGSDKQVYVCLHGHVCDARGHAKNQPRGQE